MRPFLWDMRKAVWVGAFVTLRALTISPVMLYSMNLFLVTFLPLHLFLPFLFPPLLRHSLLSPLDVLPVPVLPFLPLLLLLRLLSFLPLLRLLTPFPDALPVPVPVLLLANFLQILFRLVILL
jgi:hypothetical protein